jgi:hypothetical protein
MKVIFHQWQKLRKKSEEWPTPEAKWTPFYLYLNGAMYKRLYWPDEVSDSFEDSLWDG